MAGGTKELGIPEPRQRSSAYLPLTDAKPHTTWIYACD